MTHRARLALVLLVLAGGAGLGWTLLSPRFGPCPKAGTPPAAQPIEAKGPRATLAGRVVDRDSRPVPRAEVTVFRPTDARLDPLTFLTERFAYAGRESEAVARRETLADGTWTFPDLPIGTYLVRATAPGLLQTLETVRLTTGAPARRPLTLVLGEGPVLSGRVVDEEGHGIAGAKVALVTAGDGGPLTPYQHVFAQSDANGAFEAILDDTVFAIVVADGYPTTTAGSFSPDYDEVTVVLRRGGRLEVLVVDMDTGTPLPGVSLLAMTADSGREDVGGSGGLLAGTTDERGECIFESARGRIQMLKASHPRYAGAVGLDPPDVAWNHPLARVERNRLAVVEGDRDKVIAPGMTSRIRIRLGKGPTIAGRVLSTDGTPIADATVHPTLSSPYSHRAPVSATTGPDGSYRLEGLQPEDVRGVVAEAPGWVQDSVGRVPPATEAAGAIARDVRMRPAPLVRGRVVDQEGQPIAAARVSLLGTGVTEPTDAAISAPDGAYRITVGGGSPRPVRPSSGASPQIEPGKAVVLANSPEYLESSSAPFRVSASGTTEAPDIVLRRGGMVAGRVVDPTGRPLLHARIEAFPAGAPHDSWMAHTVVRTPSSGSFEITALPEGKVALEVWADGFAATRLTLSVTERAPVLDLELRVAAPHHVRGIVLDPDGRPVDDADVRVSGRLEGKEGDEGFVIQYVSSTDKDGTFDFAEMPEGRATVRVTADGMRSMSAVLQSDAPPHEFRLSRIQTASAARIAEIDAEISELQAEIQAAEDTRVRERLEKRIEALRRERSHIPTPEGK